MHFDAFYLACPWEMDGVGCPVRGDGMAPTTRYARSGDVHIAYQVFGSGASDLVFVPGFVSHIENYWDEPGLARWLDRLGQHARVIMFDKRGTGLSDRVAELPGLDLRMDDVVAVMRAAGSERATVLGISEGGPMASLFAATYPERCSGLVLYGSFARFTSWLPTAEHLEGFIGYIQEHWGSGGSLPLFGPSKAGDAAFQQWWGRFERLGASPSAATALMRMNSQIDVADILSSIRVPTLVLHRSDDVTVSVEGARLLADRIPDTRMIEFAGSDHLFWIGDNGDEILASIIEFVTGTRTDVEVDRVLATVLMTDIVGSTARAESLGDRGWRDLLDAHDTAVRRELARFRGHEVKSLGDGFLATFDGPARAIRCATARVRGDSMWITTRLPTVIAGHADAICAMLNVAIGGTAASEAREVAVKPTGRPPGSLEVTIATPAAWRRKALLKASMPSEMVSSAFGAGSVIPWVNSLSWGGYSRP